MMKFFLGAIVGSIIVLILSVFLRGKIFNYGILTTKETGSNINLKKDSVKEDLETGASKKNNIENKIINDNFIPNSKYEYGTWLWSSPLFLKEKIPATINNIKLAQFNTVYLSVDDFLILKNTDKENYLKQLHNFVRQAKDNDLVVDVVVGAPEWAEPRNRWQAYKFIDLLVEYNNKYPDAKIRGLQYDIEPYLLTDYENNKEKVLTNFVEFVDIVSTRLERYPEISLTIVLPHFYDNKQGWTPLINYQQENLSVFDQVVRSLNKIERGKIILMAYRNSFTGENGVKDISQVEFESTKGKTRIIIAQETKKVTPVYVTFWGLSQKDLFRQLNRIHNNYESFENFAGVAIHDFESFLELKK